jgi:hypothetical protein
VLSKSINGTLNKSVPLGARIFVLLLAICFSHPVKSQSDGSEFTTKIEKVRQNSATQKESNAAGQIHQKTSQSHKELVQPASTKVYYTSKIISVPNTKHYKPYVSAPPPVHATPPRSHAGTVLSLQVGKTEIIGTHKGLGPASDEIMRHAPALGSVKAVTLSSNTFRQWIADNHRDMSLEKYAKQSVIVVKGKWDHAEHVLEMAGIPHLDLNTGNFSDKLANAAIVIVNCPGELTENSDRQLRAFVENGGYLLTTDWALSGCLQDMFPDCVSWQGAYSDAEVVDGVVVTPKNELLQGAANMGPWKLDDKSEIVRTGSNELVKVLIRSRQLSTEDPNNLGILALTFPYGKGRVLHLVGHFNNNTNMASINALPDPSPQTRISLRQIVALNFVLEALAAQSPITSPYNKP